MFSYPADLKNIDGKLLILYECFPMAKIVEEAGGKAIIGKQSAKRILEITPKKYSPRCFILQRKIKHVHIKIFDFYI
jgi:fructose-1,6-bisphosphatase I